MLGKAAEGGNTAPDAVISVIVPARNAAATIEATLQSLVPDRDLISEILLIDDASDDDTVGIARKTVCNYALPLMILEANVNSAGAARNIGLSQAKGEFIFFLDSDDEVISGGLRLLHDALRAKQNAGLCVGGNIRRTSGRPDKLKLPHGYRPSRVANARNYFTNRLWPIAMGSALVSHDIGTAFRFPEDLILEEDTCYWAAVLASSDVEVVLDPVLYYNLNEERTATRFTSAPRREFLNIATAYTRLIGRELDKKTVKWRKSWVALRIARQLIISKEYRLAGDLMRVVLANPDFSSGVRARVLRYSMRIRTGLFFQRLRSLRAKKRHADRAFPV